MKTQAMIGVAGLVIGVALGGLCGAWFERQSQAERMAAAVQEEAGRAERLEAEVSELRDREAFRDLHLRLGRIAIEADRQDYGTAGERAGRFFDDLAGLASRTPEGDPRRSALQRGLAVRDEVIAGLATARPATAESLGQLYLDFFSSTQTPARPEMEVVPEASG